MKLKLSEKQIQNQIESYLWMKGYYVMRMNSGKYKAYDENGKARMIRGQDAGTPDLQAFTAHGEDSKLIFFEIKVPGNKPTYLQTEKMKQLREHGARCYVVHSLEEVQKII